MSQCINQNAQVVTLLLFGTKHWVINLVVTGLWLVISVNPLQVTAQVYLKAIDKTTVTFGLTHTASRQNNALQSLEKGSRLRLIIEFKGKHNQNFIIDRWLSYSPFVNRYIIVENNTITDQDTNFNLLFSRFLQWSIPKENLKYYTKTRLAYMDAFYQFPFSFLYLLPGQPKVERFSLNFKKL